jgi:hypothetical protein
MQSFFMKSSKTILIFIAIWFLVWAFYRVMSMGGRPTEDSGRTIYGLRPGMRVLSWAGVCLGGWLFWLCWLAIHNRNLPEAAIEVTFGLLCLAWGGFILSTHMILDDIGLHYERWPRKVTTIRWDELDHFEIGQQDSGSVFHFLSKSDERISVTAIAYDLQDMCNRISDRIDLPEHPYKRRRWYG